MDRHYNHFPNHPPTTTKLFTACKSLILSTLPVPCPCLFPALSHSCPYLVPVLSLSCPCLKPGAEPWSLGSCCCILNKISFKGCLLQGYDKLTHPQLNCKFIPYQYETIFLLSFEYFLEERFPLIELKMAYFHEVTIMILLWSYFDLHSISGAPSAKFYISQNTNDAFCNLQNDPTHFNNTATSMLILLPLI